MERGPSAGQRFNAFRAQPDFTVRGEESDVEVKGGGTSARSTTEFDTTRWTLQKLPADYKTADADRDLATRYPAGTSFKGVTSGSEEERRVKGAVVQMSNGLKNGSTVNVLVDDVDGKGNPGRVRVARDAQGKVSAELLGTGAPTPATTFKDIDEAKAKLKSDFGIKGFSETGGAKWTKEELEKVYGAFSKLSPAERKALDGVTLDRAKNNGTAKEPNRIGVFDWSGGSKGTTASRSEKISLDDRVFAADKKSFTGTNEPASYETITHEAGHAVETKKMRDALSDYSKANAAYNKALKSRDKTAIASAKSDLDTKKAAYQATLSAPGTNKSKQLSDFETYVNANNIEPPTAYAGTGMNDFYAESFMLYKTNPDALKAANKPLFDYFDQQKHL